MVIELCFFGKGKDGGNVNGMSNGCGIVGFVKMILQKIKMSVFHLKLLMKDMVEGG